MYHNKYRLSTRAYRDAQRKKMQLVELQLMLDKISNNKNIQCSSMTENYMDRLYDSISMEIEACDKVPEFGDEEVYRYHKMTFKKVYDDTINPEESCKHCDIKCPCYTWNAEIGCLKHQSKDSAYMVNSKLSEADKERLCINFNGVFKNLTPEEEEKYKVDISDAKSYYR